ncbi:MAG: FHA domain-containing protein [Pirellulales bacterium]|nr:FHA domain-containing protein [Pirellulales bacterium]
MSDPNKRSARLTETVEMRKPVKFDANAKLEAIALTVQVGFISGDPPVVPAGEKRTLGRTDESDFQTPLDAKTSRIHFSIECCQRNGILRDLGSRNGTYLNGQRVMDDCEIQHGDQIVAGATIVLVRFMTS